jgi:hypothetical protein
MAPVAMYVYLKKRRYKMKKIVAVIVFSLTALSVYGQAASLDEAIRNSVTHIQGGLASGAKIVVYQFQSHNTRISDYVLKEMFNLLVNSRNFTVLDRTSQEVINAERNFQYVTNAGMISDESLMSLTKTIGAQAIVTGSLDDAVSEYRFYIKVIGTETTQALVSFAGSVSKSDKRIKGFQPKSGGEKIGTGALNIVFGLGSYIEGDISGGLTLTAGYAVATGLFIIEALALDWDSPAAGVPGTIGFGVAGLTLVYGFARPFIYNRSPKLAAVIDNTRPNIVMVPDIYGNNSYAVQLSYTITF